LFFPFLVEIKQIKLA